MSTNSQCECLINVKILVRLKVQTTKLGPLCVYTHTYIYIQYGINTVIKENSHNS